MNPYYKYTYTTPDDFSTVYGYNFMSADLSWDGWVPATGLVENHYLRADWYEVDE